MSIEQPFDPSRDPDAGADDLIIGPPSADSNEACVRFCWIREAAPGHLEHDGGIRIPRSEILAALLGVHPAQQRTDAVQPVSLETVLAALSGNTGMDVIPQWARRRLAAILGPLASLEQREQAAANAAVLIDVAARLSEAAAGSDGIEVHLPSIDRRNWSHRFDILARTRFVHWAGRVVPEALLDVDARNEYYARWLTVCSVVPGISTGITCLHTQSATPSMLRMFLPVPHETKGAPAPVSGPVTVEIQQTLAGTACLAWNTAPPEGSASYFAIHAKASIAVQAAVRRWLAWHWLSDIRRFENIPDASAVLAFLVSRPCLGRSRSDFTYDTLTDDWMYLAFQFARRPLRLLLRPLYAALKAAGRMDLALKFHPEQAKFIIQRIRRQRKAIRAMVAAEAAVVNYVLQFGLALRGATDVYAVCHTAPDHAKAIGARLCHIFREQDLSWLATNLMMEATNALWVAMGGDSALRTTVTVRPAEAGLAEVTPAVSVPAPDRSQPAPLPC